LRASLSLDAGHTLNTLRTLWTGRTLRARLTFRSRIPAAGGKRKRNANDEYWKNSHDAPATNEKLPAAKQPTAVQGFQPIAIPQR
jgi:hypothetical protein